MNAPGFNVIGYPSSNSGIGVATRSVVGLLERLGVPLSVFDVEAMEDDGATGRATHRPIRAADLPHPVNLLVLPINVVGVVLDRFESRSLRDARLNAALCFWELSTIPPRWLPPLRALDVVVATSDYMRQVLEVSVAGPWIVPGALPCDLPAEAAADRARFGIAPGQVAFVFSFEPASDPVRKNPMAVVEAFLRGVGEMPEALLVVKVKNATHRGGEHAIVGELRQRIADHPRVRVVTDDLGYADVISLYASCDVFVSLHRAEGLGLAMLEAMALGKPVVATGWSGNLTFMDHRSAALVRYELVPVQGSIRSYSEDQLEDTTVWAEPDVDHAAAWMRRLVVDRDLRERMGRAAGERHRAYLGTVEAGGFVREIAAILDSSCIAPRPRRVDADETRRSSSRQSRLARIQELERQLAWITGRPAYRMVSAVKRVLQRKTD